MQEFSIPVKAVEGSFIRKATQMRHIQSLNVAFILPF